MSTPGYVPDGPEVGMDRHLNLFHGYAQGDHESLDRGRVLENNVTRALLLLLRSSPRHLQERLIEEIAGVPVDKADLVFDLQAPKEPAIDALRRSNMSRKVILGIAPRIQPAEVEFPKTVEDAVTRALAQRAPEVPRAGKKREGAVALRQEIESIRKSIEDDGRDPPEPELLRRRIGNILGVETTDLRELGGDADTVLTQLRYLDDLLRGSVPDGWIGVGEGTVILLENKIRGGLVRAQLLRHRRKWFPNADEQVEIRQRSWADVYRIVADLAQATLDSGIFAKQFVQYLEGEDVNLAPMKLSQSLFGDFGGASDPVRRTALHAAHRRLVDAAPGFAPRAPGPVFLTVPRQFAPDYLGVELIDERDKGTKFSSLIHLSVGIEREGVRIYVVVEPVALIRRLVAAWNADREGFEAALWDSARDLPELSCRSTRRFRVTRKKFFAMGKHEYAQHLAERIENDPAVVSRVLNDLAVLSSDDPPGKEAFLREYPGKYKSRSLYATLVVEYLIPVEAAVAQGDRITEAIREAVEALVPPYSFLRTQALQRGRSRRRASSRQ